VLYNGVEYSGTSEVSLGPGDYPSLLDVGMPDKEVRSVSIPTPGCTLTLYEELDFLGGTFVVAANTIDLVEAGGTAYASAKLACIPDPVLILYSSFYFNGQSAAFGVGDVNNIAAASGFPDNELTSLRFLRQNCEARLFDVLDFATEGEGDNRIVSADNFDLSSSDFNDLASSMSVACTDPPAATNQPVTMSLSGEAALPEEAVFCTMSTLLLPLNGPALWCVLEVQQTSFRRLVAVLTAQKVFLGGAPARAASGSPSLCSTRPAFSFPACSL
jgi:hypothetical protein